jgi:acyl carrier protein
VFDTSVFMPLTKVIGDHFQIDPGSITPGTSALDVFGWDSMAHVLLLLKIEETFQVSLDEVESYQATNVGELAEVIEQTLRKGVRE